MRDAAGIEKIVANLVQKVERRFYGKYRGVVVDNADPEKLGRLKVRVPSVLGPDVVTGWALPCVPYGGDVNQGFLFIPETDAGVWIEFEEGDLEFPIWVGTYWSKPGGDSELPKPNGADGTEEGSVQDPVTRKIIKTKKGHSIELEDADDSEVLIIKYFDGDKKNVIAMNNDGITVLDSNDNTVTMNGDGIEIVDTVNSHTITMSSDGITIKDASGNEIKTDSSGITCNDLSGNKIVMDSSSGFVGPGINLNSGSRICLEGLIDWLLSHQHIGNMGAPTPLFPADLATLMAKKNIPKAGILSDSVKAG